MKPKGHQNNSSTGQRIARANKKSKLKPYSCPKLTVHKKKKNERIKIVKECLKNGALFYSVRIPASCNKIKKFSPKSESSSVSKDSSRDATMEDSFSSDDSNLVRERNSQGETQNHTNNLQHKKPLPFSDDYNLDSDNSLPNFLKDGYNFETDSDVYKDAINNEFADTQQPEVATSFDTNRVVIEEEPKKVLAFTVPQKQAVILVINHPTNVTLLGCLLVKVLSGTVTILGYDLNSENNCYFPVFSSKKICCLQLETKSVDHDWRKAAYLETLKNKLKKIAPEDIVIKILEKSQNSCIVCLKKNHQASEIEFALSYIPGMFPLSTSNDKSSKILKSYGISLGSDDCDPIEMNYFHEQAAEKILSHIHISKVRNDLGPRIIVFGKRGLGKSTVIRYFINKVLNVYENAYLLDGDIGQSEFTPPGCLSLTKVTEPCFGPPFTHLRTPERMMFFGSVSVEHSPSKYNKYIEELYNYYTENYSSEPLFINTIGWIKSTGLKCLNNMIECIKPTILVELVDSDECNMDEMKINDELSNNIPLHIKISECKVRWPKVLASTRRSLSVLSYFGRCQPHYKELQQLNHFKPYCVSIKDIAIHLVMEGLPVDCILYPILGSLVALCNVDETKMLVSPVEGFPKIIEGDPVNTCLGFGFVRSIDFSNKLLYIITPESLDVLKNVNTIMKGNVLMPQEVFTKQKLVGVPLPYTIQRIAKRSSASHKIKKRRGVKFNRSKKLWNPRD